MDSANPSSGLAAFFAALLARLTGRPDDAPEPADSPPNDLPEDTWAHGAPLHVPIPPADLIAKMSDAEQAQFWKDWAIQASRAGNEEVASDAWLTAEAYRRKARHAAKEAAHERREARKAPKTEQ